MKNPKTTILGILVITSALSSALLDYLQHGNLPNIATLLPALLSGFAAINAKDDNVTNALNSGVAKTVPLLALLLLLPGCQAIPVNAQACYYTHGAKICTGYSSAAGITVDASYGK